MPDPQPITERAERTYRIKPLVWTETDGQHYAADDKYVVFPRRTGKPYGVCGPGKERCGLFPDYYMTLAAAKAAAESHYRERLLSALEEVLTP